MCFPRFGGGDPNVLKDLVSAGMMGRKSGKGCYIYTEDKGERPLNTWAADIFKKYSLEPVKVGYNKVMVRLD
jgi:enoyl-CoA hydratase/long-chain 3-hydroxyacyl-CoA dehydrogenase